MFISFYSKILLSIETDLLILSSKDFIFSNVIHVFCMCMFPLIASCLEVLLKNINNFKRISSFKRIRIVSFQFYATF